MNKLFSFGLIEEAVNRCYSINLFYSSQIRETKEQINNILEIITFTKETEKAQNKAVRRNRETFFLIEEDLKKYREALKIEQIKLNILNTKRNEFRAFIYTDKTKFYKTYLEEKQRRNNNKSPIIREQDNNIYYAIDSRFKLTRSDLNLKIRELFLTKKISKTEYKKATKGQLKKDASGKERRIFIYSQNLKERIYLWRKTRLQKIGHKKHTLKKKTLYLLEYDNKRRILTKVKLYKDDLLLSGFDLEAEIKTKIQAEKNIRGETHAEAKAKRIINAEERRNAEATHQAKAKPFYFRTEAEARARAERTEAEAEHQAEAEARAEAERTEATHQAEAESREAEAEQRARRNRGSKKPRKAERQKIKAEQKPKATPLNFYVDFTAFKPLIKADNSEADIFQRTEAEYIQIAIKTGINAEKREAEARSRKAETQ
jgi:hypothetical protein